MSKNIWKLILILGVFIISAYYLYPTFRWYTLSSKDKDLLKKENQELEIERTKQDSLDYLRKNWKSLTIAEKDRIETNIRKLEDQRRALNITSEERDKIEKLHNLQRQSVRLGLDLQGGVYFILKIDKEGLSEDAAKDIDDRALEVIRSRIDQYGVSEPDIRKEGKDRISVQIPGFHNVRRAENIVTGRGYLEFRLVADESEIKSVYEKMDKLMVAEQMKNVSIPDTSKVDTTSAVSDTSKKEKSFIDDITKTSTGKGEDSDLFKDNPFTGRVASGVKETEIRLIENMIELAKDKRVIPTDLEFVWGMDKFKDASGIERRQLYLLKKKAELTGEAISTARYRMGSGYDVETANRYLVDMTFTREAANKFAEVTGNNVGKHLAIVLNGKVKSAPVIKTKIRGGEAQITGNFSLEEAKDLAIVLRAGALPAPLRIIEQRTIGPSLGRDSINMGIRAGLIATIFVIAFMIIYYKASGLLADAVLILNVVLLVAFLAGFKFTLTLPGLAGIILTIGMAVDANILILERIREEILKGRPIKSAVDTGYSRAFLTIFDANLTTIITAIALYNFGTGPIKGFAVTLTIGLLVNMFTAILLTKVVYDFILSRFRVEKLSI